MKHYLLLVAGFFSLSTLFAQTKVSGKITDDSHEALIGASVVVKGSTVGTVSDIDGNYQLTVNESTPFTLVFSYVGFTNQEVQVNSSQSNLNIVLSEESSILQEVVVSASRVEEKLLESPVSIEKLDLQTIKSSASADYYDQMTKLKGVTNASGSLTFNAINTRGFGGIANTRFVQLVDGVDNAAPLLNFPMGNLIGLSELDIANIELVPGAASALYGPNAFNGIMMMTSKNPFDYKGFSVSQKVGFTKADNDKANPLSGTDIRYGNSWGKFGFKVTGSYFRATDWLANDYDTDLKTFKNRSEVNSADFNGINLYGDENILGALVNLGQLGQIGAGVDAGAIDLTGLPANHPYVVAYGTRNALASGAAAALVANSNGQLDQATAEGLVKSQFSKLPSVEGFRRTGIPEEDLLKNRNATSLKVGASLYYRPTENVELSYAFRYGRGDAIYQGSERYILRNFGSFSNKLEATGKNFMVRTYMTQTNAGDSYNATALGSYANELMYGTAGFVDPKTGNPEAGWGATYLGGFVAGMMGAYLQNGMNDAVFGSPTAIAAANAIARGAADSKLPARGSEAYNAAINTIRHTLFQHTDPANRILGGSKFIDHSRMFHTEATYDFTSLAKDKLGILVGANHRMYGIFGEGTVLNEDPDGTGAQRIKINEYGTFVQLTKKMIDERLRISASIRYDKNENFDGVWSPRVAAVASLGDKRQHNIRASFQTGFRNPDTQAQFIYFPVATTLLGGAKKNAERYHIYEGGAYTPASFEKFKSTKNIDDLEVFYMDYIRPEKLSAVELGYKSVIKNLYIDINGYFNWYKDFITQTTVVLKDQTTQKGVPVPGVSNYIENGTSPTYFRPYHNVSDRVISWGSGIALSYKLRKNFMINTNYNYMDFDTKDNAAKSDIDFNSPSHLFNVGISNHDVAGSNFGFNVSYRWQSEYFWVSSFGSGDVPAYGNLDASISYNIKKANMRISAGATNIAGPNYHTNIGGPMVGRTGFLSLTYDGTLSKKNK
ncbi:MAG: TonB-dependent receptor [Chitinophagales bacterium]|nr:TonB-dependent receptor [Chitinophagales bacterium]